MNELHSKWKKEYEAPFSGWDFSHLKNRLIDENPPWDYREMAAELVRKSTAVLDMGTGGGEFLSSFTPLPEYTVAIEGWHPNVAVAKSRLEPLGARVLEADGMKHLPFENEEFDLVLNRHSDFTAEEVFRVLKPVGTFLTQQVGGNNLQDFAEAFEIDTPLPFLKETFDYWKQEIQEAGFKLIKAEEWRGKMEFMDVGAIVYFIKAIPWTVPDFNFEKHFHHLEKLQHRLDGGERLVYTQVRYLFQAEKPC